MNMMSKIAVAPVAETKTFAEALAAYDAARAPLQNENLPEGEIDRLSDIETEAAEAVFANPARDALIRFPAPDTAAVLSKLEAAWADRGELLDGEQEIILADLRRISKPAAPSAAIAGDVLSAFAKARDAYHGLNTLPGDATEGDCDVFHHRIDAAHTVLKATPATSPIEAAAKLRIALTGINQGAEDTLIAYGLQSGDELTEGDFFQDLLFATIRDLETMAATGSDPHPSWLAERDAIMARLELPISDTSEGEADVAADRLNALDNLILETPASSREGATAKLLTVVKALSEGHGTVEEEAARIVAEVQPILGTAAPGRPSAERLGAWDEAYRSYVAAREAFDGLDADVTQEEEALPCEVYRAALRVFMQMPAPHVTALNAKIRHAFEIEPELHDDYRNIILADAARLAASGGTQTAWEAAEAALAAATAAIEQDDGDEVPAALADAHTRAELHLVSIEPQTVAQAVRQIEVALKDGPLAGVDTDAIIERAKRLAA